MFTIIKHIKGKVLSFFFQIPFHTKLMRKLLSAFFMLLVYRDRSNLPLITPVYTRGLDV